MVITAWRKFLLHLAKTQKISEGYYSKSDQFFITAWRKFLLHSAPPGMNGQNNPEIVEDKPNDTKNS